MKREEQFIESLRIIDARHFDGERFNDLCEDDMPTPMGTARWHTS